MSFYQRFNSTRPVILTGVFSPDYSKIYNQTSTVPNSQIYPKNIPPWTGQFYILNYGIGDIAENSNGDVPDGWDPTVRTTQQFNEIVNALPKNMLKNLVLVPGKNGMPIPVAGAYFTKMMDHVPGTIEPFSCLITDSDGKIQELTIQGNLSLSGGSDADTALNTFGKNNEIDCGFILEE